MFAKHVALCRYRTPHIWLATRTRSACAIAVGWTVCILGTGCHIRSIDRPHPVAQVKHLCLADPFDHRIVGATIGRLGGPGT